MRRPESIAPRGRHRYAAVIRAVGATIACIGLLGCRREPGATSSLDVYRARLAAIERRAFFQTTRIVDRHGVLLAEIAPRGNRTWVSLERVPRALRLAVIATEDRTFYANSGVDASAIVRAVVQNARAGGTISGASTITMQLVRLVALDPDERYDQSVDRKLREAHLAAEIAERLSRDEILEAYLNVAYFGRGAYGVEAAAQAYFARHVWDLSVGESALLVGLLQAPSTLDPRANPVGAASRQRIVLDAMVAVGAMTPAEGDRVWRAGVSTVPAREAPARRARHFVDHVLAALPDLVGPELAALGGLTVTTSLDVTLSEDLAAIAASHVRSIRSTHDVGDAALVVVHPGTGDVIAMIGGVDYDEPASGQVNAAVTRRQVGSAFKPIAYAAALDAGFTTASVLWDVPVAYPIGDGTSFTAVNYDGRYRGPVRLREALATSLNAPTVQLVAESGLEATHALANALGLALGDDPWRYGLSLALGGAEATLLDLTAAYAAFAAGGRYAAPTVIRSVQRIGDGRSLYECAATGRAVVSPETAWLVTDLLADAEARRPAFGSGAPLATSRPSAVKTGTTDDFRDNLTVGYTPYVAVGVWAGNKDGHPMREASGITGAAPIWHDAMERLIADHALRAEIGAPSAPADTFAAPAGIVRASVCDLATLVASGTCSARTEVFARGSEATVLGTSYDYFRLRPPGATRGDACAVPSASTSGTLLLLPPIDARVAESARTYALLHGTPLAPALCSETMARSR